MHKYPYPSDGVKKYYELQEQDYSTLKGKQFDDILRFKWFAGYRQASVTLYSISTGQPFAMAEIELESYIDKGLLYCTNTSTIEGLYLAGTFEYTKKGPKIMVKLVKHRQLSDSDL